MSTTRAVTPFVQKKTHQGLVLKEEMEGYVMKYSEPRFDFTGMFETVTTRKKTLKRLLA